MNGQFVKVEIQMANRHVKRYPSSLSGKCKQNYNYVPHNFSENGYHTAIEGQMMERIYGNKYPNPLLVGHKAV